MSKLVVCGDSFAKGIGCRDLDNEPYGALVAKKLGLEYVNLAKGSSTNYSIHLQVLYMIDHIDDVSMVLVTNTSYDRIEWFPTNYEPLATELTNFDVNYHQYPPYQQGSYSGKIDGEPHPMEDDDRYNGNMFTENLVGVIDYFDNIVDKGIEHPDGYYKRFYNEPKKRMRVLYDYAKHVHDTRINRLHSIGAITMVHNALNNAGIRHLIGTDTLDAYARYIDRTNQVNIDWGQLGIQYPDDLPSWHASAEGHVVAADRVIDKINENGWK